MNGSCLSAGLPGLCRRMAGESISPDWEFDRFDDGSQSKFVSVFVPETPLSVAAIVTKR